MDRSSAEAITQQIISMSDADETEVLWSQSVENLTRYSDNIITQNVCRNSVGVSIRMHYGKRVGRVSTDRFDRESLQRVLIQARDAAEQQQDNPDLLPMLGAAQYRESPGGYFADTLDFSPEERAEAIAKLVSEAGRKKAEAAGIFSTGGEAVALANSKGQFAYYEGTGSTLSLTVDIGGFPGWAEDIQRDVAKIDPQYIAQTAIQKAVDSHDPLALDPGKYTVVLEPAAVTDFLMFMAFEGFGGLNFNEGRSFLSGKLGQRIMGENITIVDDPYSPLNPGMPFDFEGQPREKVLLIDKGIAHAVVHDRHTAMKAKNRSTGHSLPQPNSTGPLPLNLVIEAGDSSLEEMIRSTERGILVTHFHYTNVIDPIILSLTGMTRDGTFLIENGKVTRPVKNMRFTQSIIEAFNRVEAISKERRAAEAFFAGNYVVPAMKISEFNFSSVSDF